MADTQAPTNHQTFVKMVHDALGSLYDTLSLQQHPLASLFVESNNSTLRRGQNLRRLLLAGIHSLRPVPNTPATSPDWRAYRLLDLRYVEGLDPQEAMRQLGLAKSQYFREQGRAIDAVAEFLWEKYQEQAAQQDSHATTREELVRIEAERLSAQPAQRGVDAAELLTDLAAIVEPLAQVQGIAARLASIHSIQGLLVDTVILRQAILSLINSVLNLPGVQHLEVRDLHTDTQRGLCIQAWPTRSASLPDDELGLCRSLVEAVHGALDVTARDGVLCVCLGWAHESQRCLLVIDDNAGMADLFNRYLAGNPWRVTSAQSGEQARAIINDVRPDIVILDVMMPGEDGWKVLLSIKNSPRTHLRDIPVIVCSVLDQPQIALTLGAVAYLPKPVSQQALIAALATLTP
jgi:CheY-like chemotaxis protein